MPVLYSVSGFFQLPIVKNSHGTKRIDDDVKASFAGSAFANERGCYIFAIRKGHGAVIPHYVGKTTRSFLSECFTDHKMKKYDNALHSDSFGTPFLFFVRAPTAAGPLNAKALSALEDYLIGLGFQQNRHLKNIKGKANIEPPFSIAGVHTTRPGKPPSKLTMFRRMLGIKE